MTTEIAGIWTDFHKELRAFIQNKTRNSTDTDDILQDVFVKIIGNFDKVKRADNLRQYLYGIVRNATHDYFRKQKPTDEITGIQEDLSEEETEALNTTIAECCIKPFIEKLPEHYRDALHMTEFQNISQKEMAERLNISYSGAKSRVQRGKDKLKALILDCCAYQSDVYGNLMEANQTSCGCA